MQHQTIQSLEDIYKIENIILDLSIHDLLTLYLNDFITLQQLEHFFNENNLTSKELQLLLCYALFPKSCLLYYHEDSLIQKCKRLMKYNKKLHSLILLLQKYIQIPLLNWIK